MALPALDPSSPFVRLMRLHQPIGIWLLMWPCWWSVALASDAMPSVAALVLFAIGSVLMRSAGCVINDIVDRDLDKHVERTKTRPLASGELMLSQALGLLAILLVLGLLVAAMLGTKVTLWGMLVMPLVLFYPMMKRITWWPQLFLGLTFNWGALLGWVAIKGELNAPAFMLYLGSVFWTLGYDTIYAHQDKADDARIGIKSTALLLGNNTKIAVAFFYALAVVFWAGAATLAGNNPWGYCVLALAGAHFAWQLKTVKLENPASCKNIFVSNAKLGLIVFIALAI